MSDVFGDISSNDNGDVAPPNDTSNNASESILISSNDNLATSPIPVSSSSSSILITTEAALTTDETVSPLDVVPSDTTTTNLEGMSDNATANGLQEETPVAIVASNSPFILDASQAIELNGEKHKFVQQFQDPESGELLVILESESGEHVALPLSTFTDGVDIAPVDGPECESIVPQANAQATAETIDGSIVYQTSADAACLLNIQHENSQSAGNDETLVESGAKDISAPITTSVLPVISDNENSATNESLQTFVPTTVASSDGTESYVIMSSADGTTDQINLAEVIGPSESSGQTFLIETPDGLVACSSAASVQDDKSITETLAPVVPGSPVEPVELSNAATTAEYVTESELTTTSTEEAILQAVTASGNIADGQIIHAVSGNQTLAYQIAATESGIQLIPMGTVPTEPTTTTNCTPVAQAKTSNRAKSSNATTLLSDQQVSAKRGKQGVSKAAKNSNSTPARLPEYMQHSSSNSKSNKTATYTPTNSNSLLGDAPGPSQLASSHRTYSRKNIVWVSPEANQSTSETSRTTSSTTTTTAPSSSAVAPTAGKSVTFAPKSNSLVDSAPRKNQTPCKTPSATSPSPKKPDAEVVIKRASPVKSVPVEKEITVSSPSNVTKAPVSPRKSPVKSTERTYQNIPISSNVTIIPASTISSPSSIVSLPSALRVGIVGDKIDVISEPSSRGQNHVTIEVVNVEVNSPSKQQAKASVTAQAAPTDAPPVKRKRGRPPKRPIEQVAAATKTTSASASPATATTAVTTSLVTATGTVTITKVEPSESASCGPAKRAKLSETPKTVEEQSSGRESRRTRRTPKRYASDDENSSEVEKGEKSIPDATETNREISILPTVEHKPSSNCETGQDTIERLTAPVEVSLEMTESTSADAADGNDASVCIDESVTLDESGSGSLTCEVTVDSSVGESMECETMVEAVEEAASKVDETKAEKKSKKSVGFKDLTDQSSLDPEGQNSASTITRKRVHITDADDCENSSVACTKSPVASGVKLTPILKTTSKYSPIVAKGKRLDSAIVCSFLPTDPQTIQNKLRESISSLADTRSPVEKYDQSAADCSFHIRYQPSASLYKPGSDSSYICQVCGYTTSRINNLVFHHKELCSVVKKLCRSLWEHEIRKQTKSNSASPYFSHASSSPSSSSPLADAPSNDDEDMITESTEFSDLAV